MHEKKNDDDNNKNVSENIKAAVIDQRRIQIFKTGGGGFLRLGFVLMPLHTNPMFFVVRVQYCKHCMLTKINVYACYMQSKFTKTNPNLVSNRGGAPGALVLDPPLLINTSTEVRDGVCFCNLFLESYSIEFYQ